MEFLKEGKINIIVRPVVTRFTKEKKMDNAERKLRRKRRDALIVALDSFLFNKTEGESQHSGYTYPEVLHAIRSKAEAEIERIKE